MIVVFMLLCSNGIQAQTTQTKLNQVELEKQFIGNWKCELGKDTTMYAEITSFGLIEGNFKIVTNDKILNSAKGLWGYDKKTDINIQASLWKSSPDIDIIGWWFTSNNTKEGVPIKDISNPENATLKYKIELKSPDLWVMTTIQNSKVIASYTYTRERK